MYHVTCIMKLVLLVVQTPSWLGFHGK